jgi:hypothetical protein
MLADLLACLIAAKLCVMPPTLKAYLNSQGNVHMQKPRLYIERTKRDLSKPG